MGATINLKNTKCIPNSLHPLPQPILLRSDNDAPVNVVSSFPYLGSILSNDCRSDLEVASNITKASQTFRSSRLLWY